MSDIVFSEAVEGVISFRSSQVEKLKLAFCKKDVNPEIYNLLSASAEMFTALSAIGTKVALMCSILEQTESVAGKNEIFTALIDHLQKIEKDCADCRVLATDGLSATIDRIAKEIDSRKK